MTSLDYILDWLEKVLQFLKKIFEKKKFLSEVTI